MALLLPFDAMMRIPAACSLIRSRCSSEVSLLFLSPSVLPGDGIFAGDPSGVFPEVLASVFNTGDTSSVAPRDGLVAFVMGTARCESMR